MATLQYLPPQEVGTSFSRPGCTYKDSWAWGVQSRYPQQQQLRPSYQQKSEQELACQQRLLPNYTVEDLNKLSQPLWVDTTTEYSLPHNILPPKDNTTPLLMVHPAYYEALRQKRAAKEQPFSIQIPLHWTEDTTRSPQRFHHHHQPRHHHQPHHLHHPPHVNTCQRVQHQPKPTCDTTQACKATCDNQFIKVDRTHGHYRVPGTKSTYAQDLPKPKRHEAVVMSPGGFMEHVVMKAPVISEQLLPKFPKPHTPDKPDGMCMWDGRPMGHQTLHPAGKEEDASGVFDSGFCSPADCPDIWEDARFSCSAISRLVAAVPEIGV